MRKIPRLLPLIAVAIGGVVLVRAIGVAPGLFEGARAWAQDGASAPAEGTPPPAAAPNVCALSEEQLAEMAGVSPAELRVLQSLSARRGELDARDQDFATLLPLMAAAEQKLDARIAALEEVKTEVAGLLGQLDDAEKAEVDRLVAVYSAMRPKDAAAVFVTLNDSVRLPVAAAMRPRALAAILAQMPPAAARELTEKLARRYDGAQEAARAAVAAATEAPAPTQAAATAPAPTQAAPQPTRAAQPAGEQAARPTPARQNRPPARATPQAEAPPRGSAAAAETPAADAAPRQPRQTVQ